jgi:hypothetical protein
MKSVRFAFLQRTLCIDAAEFFSACAYIAR